MDLTPVEQRILGCLLEKHRTTPDQYPLTLNALRLACNQATNRDPVTAYDEADLRPALERLSRRRWIRFASGHGSRVAKYRHLMDEVLAFQPDDQAVIAVLLLRGPQTPGELKGRGERLHPFADLDAVHATLDRLAERGLVRGIGRRPGQKEDRWQHLFGEDAEGSVETSGHGLTHAHAAQSPVVASSTPAPAPTFPPTSTVLPANPVVSTSIPSPPPLRGHDARIATLEAQVAELRGEVARLNVRLDASSAAAG